MFFIDRALGKNHVPNALINVGETVEIHDAHFNQDAFDTDWLPAVAIMGWVVLTADKKIVYRHLERLAVEQFDCTGVRIGVGKYDWGRHGESIC